MITMYGGPGCSDCRRSERFLDSHAISYRYIDLEITPGSIDEVTSRNSGKRIIPTIIFEDGSYLAEPSDEELADKLGLS